MPQLTLSESWIYFLGEWHLQLAHSLLFHTKFNNVNGFRNTLFHFTWNYSTFFEASFFPSDTDKVSHFSSKLERHSRFHFTVLLSRKYFLIWILPQLCDTLKAFDFVDTKCLIFPKCWEFLGSHFNVPEFSHFHFEYKQTCTFHLLTSAWMYPTVREQKSFLQFWKQ